MVLSRTQNPRSEDQTSQLQGALHSEVRLSAKVAPDGTPGVYRLNRVTVKTYGGREHHYSAQELGEMGFEIVEEPDNRPVVLQIEMGFRTEYLGLRKVLPTPTFAYLPFSEVQLQHYA
jgi:hypothetical protein